MLADRSNCSPGRPQGVLPRNVPDRRKKRIAPSSAPAWTTMRSPCKRVDNSVAGATIVPPVCQAIKNRHSPHARAIGGLRTPAGGGLALGCRGLDVRSTLRRALTEI